MKRFTVMVLILALVLAGTACAGSISPIDVPVRRSAENREAREGKNLLPLLTEETSCNGITFTADNGTYTANGTSTATAFLQLSGGTHEVPDWTYDYIGETIQVQYSTDTRLRLLIRAFSEEQPEGYVVLDARRGTSFVMPDVTRLTGLWVRLQVPAEETLENVRVKPVLSWHSREKNPPMLTIIDDDGGMKYFEQLYPLALEKGVSVSSAVTINRVESGEEKWMRWEQIQQCHANGMEILCHTYTHPTPADLEGVARDEIEGRYRLAKEILQEKGVYTTDFLVYSSSTGDMDKVREAARPVFGGGALVGYNSTNFRNADPYALPRYRIDYDYNYDPAALRALLDELNETGGWMIWMMHTSGKEWNADSLNAIAGSIDYCREIGIPVVTVGTGMQEYFGK